MSPGDTVAKDQPLLEVQADKAALDVPSPIAGRVAELRVKVGDQVKVGQVFCVIERAAKAAKEKPARTEQPAKTAQGKQVSRQSVAAVEEHFDEPQEPPPPPETAPPPPEQPRPAARPAAVSTAPRGNGEVVLAGPATRRLAREFGVDLGQVTGSAKNGRVTQDDVKGYVQRLAFMNGSVGAVPARSPLPALRGLRPRRTRVAQQGAPPHRPADEPRLEPHPPRHPARRGRRHRTGGVPQVA